MAIVLLDGRSYYLGEWNSPESRTEYDRLIAEWLANGRKSSCTTAAPAVAHPKIAEVILEFWHHAEVHHRHPNDKSTGELINLKVAPKPLRSL